MRLEGELCVIAVGRTGNQSLAMLETIYEYCRAKACVTEWFPFDQDTLVIKVCGKIFAIVSLEKTPLWISLKCDPTWAIELREAYKSVQPGYHLNKQHWNSVVLDSSIPLDVVRKMIDMSYDLVVAGFNKAQKEELREALNRI